MIKVGALVGCGVYWAIHHGIKLPDAAVKELHLDDAAEAMERKTKGLFDLNGDGEINSEDLTIGKDEPRLSARTTSERRFRCRFFSRNMTGQFTLNSFASFYRSAFYDATQLGHRNFRKCTVFRHNWRVLFRVPCVRLRIPKQKHRVLLSGRMRVRLPGINRLIPFGAHCKWKISLAYAQMAGHRTASEPQKTQNKFPPPSRADFPFLAVFIHLLSF